MKVEVDPMATRSRVGTHCPVAGEPGRWVRCADEEAGKGWLVYGTEVDVYPGRFVVRVELVAEGAEAEDKVATVDVAFADGAGQLGATSVYGVAGRQEVLVEFEVEEWTAVEPRVFYQGRGAVAVWSIGVEEVTGAPGSASASVSSMK